MKKILITGIAGFIGFHLALFLKKRGDFVIGCDNFNAYYDVALKMQRAEILKNSGITVVESDICDRPSLEKHLFENGITHCVHLAAQAGVRHSLKHPGDYVQANLNGFVQVLEACRKKPEMKFIFASSSSVYGLNKKIPFSETDTTDHPVNLYGATKKADELMAFSYHHLFKIPMIGLRYFTVYGPWGRPDMAYFSFAQAIAKGEPIKVFHEGKMQRDFTYIDDIVKGTAAAIDYDAEFEIFNLGNHQPVEVNVLISLLEKGLGKKAIKEFLPMQSGEVLTTYADISKANKLLGFSPTTSLEQGMEKFLDWFQKYS